MGAAFCFRSPASADTLLSTICTPNLSKLLRYTPKCYYVTMFKKLKFFRIIFGNTE